MPKGIDPLKELIEELHKAFATDHVDIDYVNHIMTSYKSNPQEWRKYAKFDRYKYTRNLVDEGNGKFNVMLLCWGPSHCSTIHDHADAHCFLKILDGSLEEVIFPWPEENSDEVMQDKERNTLKLNQVGYINDSIGLHRVENVSHIEPAVSLHVYCPPYDKCQIFDERTGRRGKCNITFYSKFGEKVKNVP